MVFFRKLRSAFSFVVLASALSFVAVPVGVIILRNGHAPMAEALKDLVSIIPFGPLVVQLVAGVEFGLLGRQIPQEFGEPYAFSIGAFSSEIAKLFFAVVIFVLLRFIGRVVLEDRSEGEGCAAGWRLLYVIISALVAACIAPLAITLCINNYESIQEQFVTLASTRVNIRFIDVGSILLLVIVGALAIKVFFFTLLKSLLVGTAKLYVAYLLILSVLVSIQAQAYAPTFEGMGALFLTVIILGGVELA